MCNQAMGTFTLKLVLCIYLVFSLMSAATLDQRVQYCDEHNLLNTEPKNFFEFVQQLAMDVIEICTFGIEHVKVRTNCDIAKHVLDQVGQLCPTTPGNRFVCIMLVGWHIPISNMYALYNSGFDYLIHMFYLRVLHSPYGWTICVCLGFFVVLYFRKNIIRMWKQVKQFKQVDAN
jgi:hypothetical protein